MSKETNSTIEELRAVVNSSEAMVLHVKNSNKESETLLKALFVLTVLIAVTIGVYVANLTHAPEAGFLSWFLIICMTFGQAVIISMTLLSRQELVRQLELRNKLFIDRLMEIISRETSRH